MLLADIIIRLPSHRLTLCNLDPDSVVKRKRARPPFQTLMAEKTKKSEGEVKDKWWEKRKSVTGGGE
jgi:hypothetical protein